MICQFYVLGSFSKNIYVFLILFDDFLFSPNQTNHFESGSRAFLLVGGYMAFWLQLELTSHEITD